jgi:lauroyl/myristoyl acyltransferase
MSFVNSQSTLNDALARDPNESSHVVPPRPRGPKRLQMVGDASSRQSNEQRAAGVIVLALQCVYWLPRKLCLALSVLCALFVLLCNRTRRESLVRVAVAGQSAGRYMSNLYTAYINLRDVYLSKFDHFRMWRMSDEQIRHSADFSGAEHLRAAYGKKLVILSAHYVGFEVALIRLSLEVSGAVVVELTPNAAFNAHVTERWKRDRAQKIIDSRSGLRNILREVKACTPTALLVEHMGMHPRYLTAPWQGSMAIRITPALELLLADADTSVLWMSVKKTARDHYACDLFPIHEQQTANPLVAVNRIRLVGEQLVAAIPHLCWTTLPLNYPAPTR